MSISPLLPIARAIRLGDGGMGERAEPGLGKASAGPVVVARLARECSD
jgi:hypothetical protein